MRAVASLDSNNKLQSQPNAYKGKTRRAMQRCPRISNDIFYDSEFLNKQNTI